MLLLDEPLAGLDMIDRDLVMDLIRAQHDAGLTICLIEHDIERTLKHCSRIVILEGGHKVAEGTPASITANPDFVHAYMVG
jgi:ABC-type branched-subunit amino acid transport system ATPase component